MTTPAPAHEVIASFDNYPAAQQLVDRLSDSGFPVQYVRIVGDGLRTVEQITGRMTNARAAAAGAASGAWFGGLIGLLFALFVTGPSWVAMVLAAVLIGAFWGAVFGFAGHWATRGRRDFASVSTLVAQRYDICVTAGHAGEATRSLRLATA